MAKHRLTVAAAGYLITHARKARGTSGYKFIIKDNGQLTKEEAIAFMENQGFATKIESCDDGVMIELSTPSPEVEGVSTNG